MVPALGPSDRDISGFGFSAGFPASRVCWVRRTVIWPRGSSSGWRSALGFRKWLNHAVCRAGTSLAQADLEFMSSILPPQSGVRPQRISWSKLAAPLGLTAGFWDLACSSGSRHIPARPVRRPGSRRPDFRRLPGVASTTQFRQVASTRITLQVVRADTQVRGVATLPDRFLQVARLRVKSQVPRVHASGQTTIP